MTESMKRRSFLGTTLAVGTATLLQPWVAPASTSPAKRNIKLGFDNFSIRDLGWKAPRILEYASTLGVDVVLFSDLDVYESLEDDYLRNIKEQADRLNIEVQAGTGGVCPTSSRFLSKFGSAEEHLSLVIRVAKTLGSPVARCYQGTMEDRNGEGGIERHIQAMIQVCKSVRNRAVDAGVKIAIENHAGDMQGWELAGLVEEAGKDYVGVTMDCGNAMWAIEEAFVNLEHLGPYAVTTGMRDNLMWDSEQGAFTAWTNIGEGQIDWNAYLDRYQQLCPNTAFILEIISGAVREFPYFKPEFWNGFPKAKASEFARFVAMAKKGKPFEHSPNRPAGERSPELTRLQQQYDLEQSLKYCKENLGLGLK